MPDNAALVTSMVIVFSVALCIPVAMALWRRSAAGGRRARTLTRAKALRLLQHPSAQPLITASHATLAAITDRLQAGRNTTVGMVSKKLRTAERTWSSELEFRRATASAAALILYGEFGRARRTLDDVGAPPSSVLTLVAIQPEFLRELLEAHDFARASVTAHQGRDLAHARSLDDDPAAPALRQQWDTYVLIAEVLTGRRPRVELDTCLNELQDAHLEVVGQWAAASAAAAAHDRAQFTAHCQAYRALAPHCVPPIAPPPQTQSV